mmetsp:Transcript_421/g.1460  ORF Transcript_421/g.1460 Transcript_421/m.1460 type:complete len:246 (-) Transcript_421:72-809(-)
MLPTASTEGRFSATTSVLPEYIRRIVHYPQMDLEYTFWQMFHLCVSPSRVYRTTAYHKQTKNQWARDDPAFVAISVFFMGVASLSYAVAFQTDSPLAILKTMMWTICIDFLLVGFIVATIGWAVANQWLRVQQTIHSVEQKVEWLYAFDIHCNSFFPVFLMLYVCQYFLVPILVSTSFLATFAANALYTVAFWYYCHITYMGYDALPFLHNTVVFLYPIGAIVLVFLITLLFNFNLCIFVMNLYF